MSRRRRDRCRIRHVGPPGTGRTGQTEAKSSRSISPVQKTGAALPAIATKETAG